MPFRSKNLILLTGAGFTKNFGGFLAHEMWSKIFNNPLLQQQQKLKEIFSKDSDFESAYSKVINDSQYDETEKQIIQKVIEDAYKKLDDATRTWVFNSDNPLALNTYGLFGEFMNLFSGTGNEKGFFFTLNQDLFMERHNQYRHPGAPALPQDFYSISQGEFRESYFVTLPTNNVLETVTENINSTGGLVYIKLHGSYGWRAATGRNQMVIGKNKEDDIAREPLLKCYFDLFRETLNENDKRLVIIGYGFRDMHINKLLVDGVQNHGLKLYIITTLTWDAFRRIFETGGQLFAKPIISGVAGYFPHKLSEIFPPNQERTTHFDEIKASLLG